MKETKPNRVSIKIPGDLHRDIDIASATSRTPIYVLIERAWRAYEASSSESSTASKVKPAEHSPFGLGPNGGLDLGKTTGTIELSDFAGRLVLIVSKIPVEARGRVEDALVSAALALSEVWETTAHGAGTADQRSNEEDLPKELEPDTDLAPAIPKKSKRISGAG